jgi:putative glutamine amidotransferase
MRERRQPIIGVTGPDCGGEAAWLFTRMAVALAGGRAVRITPRHPRDVEHLDALIIGGGADVEPNLYGQELLHVVESKRPDQPLWRWLAGLIVFPATWLIRKLAARCARDGGRDARRDRLEWSLLDQAVARGLPVLGICRGQQLINVYFGGSLHQCLRGFYTEDHAVRTILPRKRVCIVEGTKLACILGSTPVRVNALHEQGCHELGRNIRVSACDRNGIVQAIEHESLPLVIGVQWHPEYLPQMPRQRAIFRALVNAAQVRMTNDHAPMSNRIPMTMTNAA